MFMGAERLGCSGRSVKDLRRFLVECTMGEEFVHHSLTGKGL